MKLHSYILISLIFSQVTISLGQDFAPIGAEWYYSSSAGGSAPGGSEYYHLAVTKDTAINEYDLRKIERTYYRYQGDSVKVEPYYIHQIVDTVYIYDPSSHKLSKIFVFNATQGDTLTFDVPYYNSNFTEDSTFRVVLDTIVTEIYDGIELKKYMLEQLDDFGWFCSFYLEKIGGYEWFLPLGRVIIPEANGPIRCYHDTKVDINVTPRPCDYRITSSIDSQHLHKFEIFPNPTTDRIKVKPEFDIDYIELYDNTGKLIRVTKSTVIDLGKYENGLYFIRIYWNKTSFIKKVIKY